MRELVINNHDFRLDNSWHVQLVFRYPSESRKDIPIEIHTFKNNTRIKFNRTSEFQVIFTPNKLGASYGLVNSLFSVGFVLDESIKNNKWNGLRFLNLVEDPIVRLELISFKMDQKSETYKLTTSQNYYYLLLTENPERFVLAHKDFTGLRAKKDNSTISLSSSSVLSEVRIFVLKFVPSSYVHHETLYLFNMKLLCAYKITEKFHILLERMQKNESFFITTQIGVFSNLFDCSHFAKPFRTFKSKNIHNCEMVINENYWIDLKVEVEMDKRKSVHDITTFGWNFLLGIVNNDGFWYAIMVAFVAAGFLFCYFGSCCVSEKH